MPESTPTTLPPPARPTVADDAADPRCGHQWHTAVPPHRWAACSPVEDAEWTGADPTSNGAAGGFSSGASTLPHRPLHATLARLRRELLRMVRELDELREGPLLRDDPGEDVIERAMRLRFQQERLVARVRAVQADGLLTLSARCRVDPVALVRAAALEVEAELGRRGARLVLDLNGDGTPAWLDAEQVLEALGCLLDDAVGHADAGGTVALRAHTADAYLAITLQDDRKRASSKVSDPVMLAVRLLAASEGELHRRAAPGRVEVSILLPLCRSEAQSRDAA
jgi:hypothetical protein